VKRPKLILGDEPTAALDYNTSLDVLEVFEGIVSKKLSTIILITHNPEIAKMANRIIKISDGVITDITVNMHPAKARELKW
jgi:putative ABC transport system ATP-binding protein